VDRVYLAAGNFFWRGEGVLFCLCFLGCSCFCMMFWVLFSFGLCLRFNIVMRGYRVCRAAAGKEISKEEGVNSL